MLNLRTAILSVALVAIAVLTFGAAAVWTGSLSGSAIKPADVAEPAIGSSAHGTSMNNNIYYRSVYGECYDVPIRDLAGCRQARPVSRPAYRSPLDVCYDVPLRELANCLRMD